MHIVIDSSQFVLLTFAENQLNTTFAVFKRRHNKYKRGYFQKIRY